MRIVGWWGATMLGTLFCLAGGAAGMAAEGSGAPFGARDPMSCAPLAKAGPPTPEEAARLLRCRRETVSAGELWLMENVEVQVGAARDFREMYLVVDMPNADGTSPVHPIAGSWTWAVCDEPANAAAMGGDANLNCREIDVTDAGGACWVTIAAEWKCFMNGVSASPRYGTPPPR